VPVRPLLPEKLTPARLRFFDTTLRDGDQAAGCAFTVEQKLSIARVLESARVDCIEAGFPTSSRADFEACRRIASEITGTEIAVMTRSLPADIRASASALSGSARGMLHLSLPVSALHIAAKLRTSERAVIERCRESVAYAAGFATSVEMGAEDATRADRAFLLDYCAAAVDSGARIVNIADTVGRSVPGEFSALVAFLLDGIPAFRNGMAILRIHCHNDFGLATANTLAGIGAGCAQIEVSALGIGERAGNASLEEIAAVLAARPDLFGPCPNLDYPALGRLARLVSAILGTGLSPFKPVTGSNTRAHASGIHQQGLAVHPGTYNPVETDPFALVSDRIVIGRHSGKAGLRAAIFRYAGISPDEETLVRLLETVKATCADVPALGITELLVLLRTAGLVKTDPVRSLSPENIAMHTGASSWPSALDTAVETLFPPGIRVETLSFSGFSVAADSPAAPEPPAQRLYLEASAAATPYRRYAIERTGTDRDRLYLDCLLDIVNAETCLTHGP